MKRTIFILATLLGMTGMSEAVAQDTKDILPGVSVENFNRVAMASTLPLRWI